MASKALCWKDMNLVESLMGIVQKERATYSNVYRVNSVKVNEEFWTREDEIWNLLPATIDKIICSLYRDFCKDKNC